MLLDDPARCIHIGDRESDIYELFCTAQELGTHFLVRTCVDRLAGDGEHTIADEMAEVAVKGQHRIEVQDDHGNPSEAILDLKYRRIRVLPPIGKQKRYPALTLTVLHAQERGVPKNRKKIDWKLITDLPVSSRREAIAKLDWYALRWKIEVFHKILKSGCKVEAARLRTAERLVNLTAICCILGWRVFWVTMLHRSAPDAPPALALTDGEIRADRSPDAGRPEEAAPSTGASSLRHQDRQAWRLSRPRQRSAARQHGRLARPLPLGRHRIGIHHRRQRCG